MLMDRSTRAACIFGLLLIISGCAEPLPEFGQVTGIVKAKGKPLKGMNVTFMPDPAKGNNLPYNGSATTDDAGRYELRYSAKGQEGIGAAVGWNRVLVVDTRYASIPQGQPLPPRLFSPEYSNPTTTPLSFDVRPGPQTIDLDLN
jgi:hypothetical protein